MEGRNAAEVAAQVESAEVVDVSQAGYLREPRDGCAVESLLFDDADIRESQKVRGEQVGVVCGEDQLGAVFIETAGFEEANELDDDETVQRIVDPIDEHGATFSER